MFCQLGTTVFDGLKSFVNWGEESEAIVVELALIGRKPKLEGAALTLDTLNLSLFLHQEFCVVEDEITSLKTSLKNYTILPLLLGNGKYVGDYVIVQMSVIRTQMDAQGNTYAATVAITLKESVPDNKLDQQQQQAVTNGFATGDKKPAVKSARVNKPNCNQTITSYIQTIKANAGKVDSLVRAYAGNSLQASLINTCALSIQQAAAKIVDATNTSGNCVYQNANLSSNAASVKAKAGFVMADTSGTASQLLLQVAQTKKDNDELQAAVKLLVSSANSVTQKVITRNGG